MPASPPVATPAWALEVVPEGHQFVDESEALDAAIRLAVASAQHGGGPFGAVITDQDLRVVTLGWNNVIASQDSTAHAEVHALRRAQRRLGTHDLSTGPAGPLTLFSSCAPCIQCLGAIYWSGLDRVVSAARSEDAERLGFQEGPVSEEVWDGVRRDKAITFEPEAPSEEDPGEPFRVYAELGGEIY